MSKLVLLTGASGLVGSRLKTLLSSNYRLLTPAHGELDIVDRQKVLAYCLEHKPDVVIHTAAFTDNTEAENDRGNTKGECWQVNVVGTQNISRASKAIAAYNIYLSTGSVFRGSKDNPGPFRETDSVTPESKVSWYGWTKSQGEKFVTDAIIRIAHPVKIGGPDTNDYVHRIVLLHNKNMLFDLFTDQYIQLTYIDDIFKSIEKLISKSLRGVFHVTSPDTVTPYVLTEKIFEITRRNPQTLKKGSITKILQSTDQPLRYHQYCTLDVSESQKRLGISFMPWRQTITNLFEE